MTSRFASTLQMIMLCLSLFAIQTACSAQDSPILPASDRVHEQAEQVRGFTCYTTITTEEISEAKAMGANTLRVMIMANDLYDEVFTDMQNIPDSSAINPAKLDRLHELVDQCQSADLAVILDIHELPGFIRVSQQPQDLRIWNNTETGQAIRKLVAHTWIRLAKEFADEPAEAVLYELLNEPEPGDNIWLWYNLQDALIKRIREIDQTHTIMATAANTWELTPFATWEPSPTIMNDGRVIIATRFYHPYDFTHQHETDAWRLRDEPDAPSAKGYPGMFNDHTGMTEYWEKDRLIQCLQPVVEFKAQTGLPVVFTEFSVIRIAPGGAMWLKDLINLFQQYDFGWTYHVYAEAGFWHTEPKNIVWELQIVDPDSTYGRLETILDGFRN